MGTVSPIPERSASTPRMPKSGDRYLPRTERGSSRSIMADKTNRGGNRQFQPHEIAALEDMADYIEANHGEKDEEWALLAMKALKINRKQTFATR